MVGQPTGSVASQDDRSRRAAYVPPVPAAEGAARVGGDVPGDPADGDVRDRCGCAVHAAVAGGRSRLGVDRIGRRGGATPRGCARRRHRRDCEMACGRTYPGRRAPAVVVVRVAQRGVGYVRRNGGGAVVRARGKWHSRDEPVAARAGRQDRPRRLVRNVLATRGRPRHHLKGRDGQPRLCGADSPVPRPDHADGHRGAGSGFDAGNALCRATRRTNRCRRHRGSGLAGHARRRGAAVHALAGKSDRAVEPLPKEAWRCAGAAAQENRSKRRVTRTKKAARKAAPPVIDPYLPANGNFGYRVSRYELELEYKVTINRLSGAATITAVTLAALQTFTLDLSDALSVTKVSVNGKRPTHFRLSFGKLHIALADALPAGAAMSIGWRYGGTPRPIRS